MSCPNCTNGWISTTVVLRGETFTGARRCECNPAPVPTEPEPKKRKKTPDVKVRQCGEQGACFDLEN